MAAQIDEKENLARMLRGQLFHSFSPELVAARSRCGKAVSEFNQAGNLSRRQGAEFWKEITKSDKPIPPAGTLEAEDEVLHEYPWIERPIFIDYGFNINTGSNVFINFNCTILDTCAVIIGSRTMIGPNVSLYSSTHPIDPDLRNGTKGPELGGHITIGEDCWIGGNVTILPNVTIGNGCTIGAASVVTKDVPPYHVAVGNPARVIRKIERKYLAEQEANYLRPPTAPST